MTHCRQPSLPGREPPGPVETPGTAANPISNQNPGRANLPTVVFVVANTTTDAGSYRVVKTSRKPDTEGPAQPTKLAYTLREAAERLNCDEKTVRRLIDRGHLRRCTKIGRVLIPCNDVEKFHEKNSEYAYSPGK